jgi:hypothetical protein
VFAAGLFAGIGSAGEEGGAATAIGLRASLNARQEVPTPVGVPAGARGRFVATLVRKGTGGTLFWRLTFSGLSGRATAAHVHRGTPGRAGPVMIGLCGPCRSGARGTAKVGARTVRALLARGAYVNVHTAKNPAGEIRGQVLRGPIVLRPPTTTATTTTTTTTYP